MLSAVLQSKQMQAMAKDPNMVRSLVELMRDPEQMEHFTGNQDLAQSLSSFVDKNPQALTQLLKDSGFEVGMSMDDVASASIEEIHAEFVRLSKSDDGIMKRLKKNNGLREHLKTTLGAVVDHAMAETERVNSRLNRIHEKKSKASLLSEEESLDESHKDKLKNFSLEELETV